MPAPTLTSMAQNAAIRNITNITDIAELPYSVVAPILARIDNPQQLRDVEITCPHIAESSGPLWQALIKRDVSNAAAKMVYPKDPKNWWKVYRKMVKQESADKAAAEEALMAAMNGLKDAKSGKETTFVPKVFALGQKKTSGFFDGVRQGGSGSGGWGGKAPMLWNAKTGKDALGAMQRATASKVKIFKPGNRNRYVPDAKSQIRAAPKSMIHDNSAQEAVLRAAAEAKKYAEPTSHRPQTFMPMAATSKAEQAFRNEEIKAQHERERRLRSLTGSTARPAMHPAPGSQSRSTTTTTTTAASSSQRPSGSAVPAKRIASLSPSPPPSSSTPTLSQSSSSQPPRPVVQRKRPAADPFLSSRKRR
jgi:elongin-A